MAFDCGLGQPGPRTINIYKLFFIFNDVNKGMMLMPSANRYVTFIDATKTCVSPGLGVVPGIPE